MAPELLPIPLPLPALQRGKANSQLSGGTSAGLIRHLDARGGGGGCSARHGNRQVRSGCGREPEPVDEMLGRPGTGSHAAAPAVVLRAAGLLVHVSCHLQYFP